MFYLAFRITHINHTCGCSGIPSLSDSCDLQTVRIIQCLRPLVLHEQLRYEYERALPGAHHVWPHHDSVSRVYTCVRVLVHFLMSRGSYMYRNQTYVSKHHVYSQQQETGELFPRLKHFPGSKYFLDMSVN